jgi:hypothetical protein
MGNSCPGKKNETPPTYRDGADRQAQTRKPEPLALEDAQPLGQISRCDDELSAGRKSGNKGKKKKMMMIEGPAAIELREISVFVNHTSL